MDIPKTDSPDLSEGGSAAGPNDKAESTQVRLSWPPPGMEWAQGIFWDATRHLGLGGLILILPLLWAIGRDYPFYSLGPFGDAWWILLLSSLVGLLVTLVGLESVFRFLRWGRRGIGEGMEVATVLQVASDRSRDMGFLLQGARAYAVLDPAVRRKIVRLRMLSAILYLFAGGIAPLGFILSILLATRGWLEPNGIWVFTLAPIGAFLLSALVARGVEGNILKGITSPRWKNPLKDGSLSGVMQEWLGTHNRLRERDGIPEARRSEGRSFLGAAVGIVILAIFIVLPTASLAISNAIGPILAMVAVPSFSNMQSRAARNLVLTPYLVEKDQGVTPAEAGEALHTLAFVGREPIPNELERPPIRSYSLPFIPEEVISELGLQPREWPEALMEMVVEGISEADLAALRTVAQHPALVEYETLARAGEIDVAGTRWISPLPPETSPIELPLPRFSSVRSGAQALIAKAAVELADGRPEEAELTLRTLISAGAMLGQEGVTIIDNLIGFLLADVGGDGLENFYRAVGREEDAGRLEWVRSSVDEAVQLTQVGSSRGDVQSALQGMPDIILSEDAIRGLRWEYLSLLSGIGPCLNAHKVVFGPDDGYDAFLNSAREALVRHESEARYFDVIQRGWLVAVETEGGAKWIERLVGLTLGGSDIPGSCAAVLGQITY